jgi:hypothetical protein
MFVLIPLCLIVLCRLLKDKSPLVPPGWHMDKIHLCPGMTPSLLTPGWLMDKVHQRPGMTLSLVTPGWLMDKSPLAPGKDTV